MVQDMDIQPLGGWVRDAACGNSTEQFFPPWKSANDVKTAIDVCGACPVREDCLTEAETDSLAFGVRGGVVYLMGEGMYGAGAPSAAEKAARATIPVRGGRRPKSAT